MASHGIRDKVAIIGMGCTNFGEHWNKSTDDLLIDSSSAALANAGLTLDDVDAFWLGTMGSGLSGLTLSRPLKIQHKPVTHVENYCATGSEAFRNACYAVASGAYDVVMASGVEKLKDSGYSGLVVSAPAGDGTQATVTAPASFSLLAPAYANKYGVDEAELKDVLTRIAWKNHRNGALNSRAQFKKEVSKGERTWSFSIYNAYNQMNPFFLFYDQNDKGQTTLKQLTIFPLIPAFHYQLRLK